MPGLLDSPPARTDVCCLHCAGPCDGTAVTAAGGTFCCEGCRSVFALLQAHDLGAFYACDVAPGPSLRAQAGQAPDRFAALDDPAVSSEFVEFDDGRLACATLPIPALHCASCVWLLEQLWKLEPGTKRSEVSLQQRTLRVEYAPAETSLRRIAERLASLGYAPAMAPERAGAKAPGAGRRLYLQIGLAGFAFGNIMIFSIPRYLHGAPLEGGFQRLFDTLNIALGLPVLLFSAGDFFRTAWTALRHRTMALEVPVALGLAVLFVRSVADIWTGRGEGFMDSFAGLVFFLLLGRLFQQKVFDGVAFDRTYRSFLPLSVRTERDNAASPVPIDRLRPGDTIRLRRGEVVPADARLLDAPGAVDYRFITGEQAPVAVAPGDPVRAGGRAAAGMRLEVTREVSQSQLAALWSHPLFGRARSRWLSGMTASFGGWFTAGAMLLAAIGAAAWWPDAAASASVATAVLIVACPCALTLAAPVTLGTAMGLLGRRGIYLQQPAVALDLSRIDLVVFDKTGTLTAGGARAVSEVRGLGPGALARVQRLARESAHPASRALAEFVAPSGIPASPHAPQLTAAEEVPGRGIRGIVDGQRVAIGRAEFVAEWGGRPAGPDDVVHLMAGGEAGWARLAPPARPGLEEAAGVLSADYDLCLLSGDHAAERVRWARLFGGAMHFRQSPEDKLAFVTAQRAAGRRVLMVGDGLNDAGALAAADVGLAVSDDTACIVPACDGLIDGGRLRELPAVLRFVRQARHVVLLCFGVSILYNGAGLALALSGALTPLASAVLMPLSSVTVIALSSGLVRWSARRVLPA